ncbi:MAG: hypothetical protein WDO73_21285 [Ignavibacteriota bacterium]
MPSSDKTGGVGNVDPLTEINEVIESEAVNLRTSIAVLGERRKLANDVLGLYDLVARQAHLPLSADEAEIGALLVMLPLLAACRFQLDYERTAKLAGSDCGSPRAAEKSIRDVRIGVLHSQEPHTRCCLVVSQ